MIIKYPDSDNALISLWNVITFTNQRFRNCFNSHHDFITILYVSSFIISQGIAYKGTRLLDELRRPANLLPRNFICLVRTTAPSVFRGRLTSLQRKAVDFLRDKCYTLVYNPEREFLNHAKFALSYHACFSERMLYHGKYYGSTNLTTAGLAYTYKPCGLIFKRTGNYEEFHASNLKLKSRLNKGDLFYLNEVLRLITYKALLYTDPNYLRTYILDHLTHLESIIQHSRRILSSTTLSELYKTYVDLLIAHNQTYAFLNEIPGKKLTEYLTKELVKISEPIDSVELEMMIPTNEKHAEMLAMDLELSDPELREFIANYISVLEKSHSLIKEYLSEIDKISDLYDEKENLFVEFIVFNNQYHRKAIKDIVDKFGAKQSLSK